MGSTGVSDRDSTAHSGDGLVNDATTFKVMFLIWTRPCIPICISSPFLATLSMSAEAELPPRGLCFNHLLLLPELPCKYLV